MSLERYSLYIYIYLIQILLRISFEILPTLKLVQSHPLSLESERQDQGLRHPGQVCRWRRHKTLESATEWKIPVPDAVQDGIVLAIPRAIEP